jgi:hypothetical protein
MKPETKFKIKIRKYLENLPYTVVFKIQQKTIRGTPDFLICMRGCFVALELKQDAYETPSPLQLYKLKEIRETGFGFATLVYPENWDSVHRQLLDFAHEGIHPNF